MSYLLSPRVLVYAGLLLALGITGLSQNSRDQTESRANSQDEKQRRHHDGAPVEQPMVQSNPPVLRAGIGILPDTGGVSLDLVLLALFGMGFGVWHLRRSASPAPRRRESDASEAKLPTAEHDRRPQRDVERRIRPNALRPKQNPTL